MTATLFGVLIVMLLAITIGVRYRRKEHENRALRQRVNALQNELQAHVETGQQTNAQLKALGQVSGEALLVCNRQSEVVYLNEVAQNLFPPIGMTNPSVIALTRQHEIDQLVHEALAGGDLLAKQIFFNQRTFKVRAVPYAHGVVVGLSDLTELQRLGRARRDFIANISHELRTPLTGIRLILETLKTPAGQNPHVLPNFIEKILVETETLSQIAQELLDLSSIESGQTTMKLTPQPMAAVLTKVQTRSQEAAQRKQQQIEINASPELIGLFDVFQIERVLLNMVHNAIKFTPTGGRIRLRAAPAAETGWVQVEVADNGGGISTEDLPRVFERFYRGDRARTTQGTGLGLAVAKHIVEAHGGKIWVESAGVPGQGATFSFTVPAVS